MQKRVCEWVTEYATDAVWWILMFLLNCTKTESLGDTMQKNLILICVSRNSITSEQLFRWTWFTIGLKIFLLITLHKRAFHLWNMQLGEVLRFVLSAKAFVIDIEKMENNNEKLTKFVAHKSLWSCRCWICKNCTKWYGVLDAWVWLRV